MTFGDGFLFFVVAVQAAWLGGRLRRDRIAGRSSVRADLSPGRAWLGALFFLALGLAAAALAVGELLSPGTMWAQLPLVGRVELHHWALGVVGCIIASLMAALAGALVGAARRHATPAELPSVRPVEVQAAYSAWRAVRGAAHPDPTELTAAARALAAALAGVAPVTRSSSEILAAAPRSLAAPLAALLESLDRARFSGEALDLDTLDWHVEAAMSQR